MSDRIKDLNSPSSWNMRIWDEEKHQWLCDGEDDVLPYYGFDIRGGEVTAMQSMDWVYRQFEHGRKLIWERSVGLTDKNGKEIYEGDIIKARDWDGDWGKYRIKWKQSHCAFEAFECRKHGKWNWTLQGFGGIEVIGNIHENPELLEGKNE
jgi:hypothetical protein